MVSFSYTKKHRVTSKQEYKDAFTKPNKRIKTSWGSILLNTNMLNLPRLGISVMRKTKARSTQRNRIKRAIRENFRINQKKLPGLDLIFVVDKCLDKAAFCEELQNNFAFLDNAN